MTLGAYGLAIAGIAAAAVAMSLPAPSVAQTPFGCSCLHNTTGVKVSYRYRWGDGQWKPKQLNANFNNALCWSYNGGHHHSPQLVLQIDADMTNGTAWSTYNLERIQSPGNTCDRIPSRGHYNISYRPGSNRTLLGIFKR